MRAIFISDTHVGAEAAGSFQVMPIRPRAFWDLLPRLEALAAELLPDVLIHGGDVAHHGHAGELADVMQALGRLAPKVVVALGNHDMVDDTAEAWRTLHPPAGPVLNVAWASPNGEAEVIGLATHWIVDAREQAAWRPGVIPVPVLTSAQRDWLEGVLSGDSGRPAIVVMHHPPTGIAPPDLGGLLARSRENADAARALEGAVEAFGRFSRETSAIFDRHERVRLVLSGHVHFGSAFHTGRGPFRGAVATGPGGRVHIVQPAFGESPHLVRIIDVQGGRIRSRVLALADDTPDVDILPR